MILDDKNNIVKDFWDVPGSLSHANLAVEATQLRVRHNNQHL